MRIVGTADVSASGALRLVLDTNVVLDWLVFEDASTVPLQRGIHERWISVVTHASALDEFRRVLGYAHFGLDVFRQEQILSAYRASASEPALPEGFSRDALLLPEGFPRCRDPDDQPFLALAYHARADGLVTKDKALLKLRRRARRFGLEILDVRQLAVLTASGRPAGVGSTPIARSSQES